MSRYTGGSAFPEHKFESYGDGAGRHVVNGGMELRDWFAGQALIGIITHDKLRFPKDFARWSYEIADAMLESRK